MWREQGQIVERDGSTGSKILFKLRAWPWPGRSVGWSVIPIHQECGFDPQSGHIQESTNECINKQDNNKSIFLSLFHPPDKIDQ